MRLTREMRTALLSGKDINLNQYLDLTPFHMEDFRQAVQQDVLPPKAPAPAITAKPDIRELAVLALLAFGIDRPTALLHVNRALARLPGCTHSTILAREAYDDFLQSTSTKLHPADPPAGSSISKGHSDNLSAGLIGL